MSNIWHLTGQAYCALSRSMEKVTEATLLSESRFIKALEVSPGLQKAIKRSNQETRQAVRALIGALYPFNLKSYLQESKDVPTLPAVVQLGADIAPQSLYLLCEQFGPEVVEKHIRYAYSREGYRKACGQGRIDSNIFLERKVFPLVETEVIDEAKVDSSKVAAELQTIIQQLAAFDKLPTEKEVLKTQRDLQHAAKMAIQDETRDREAAIAASAVSQREKEAEIATKQHEIETLALALDIALDELKDKRDEVLVGLSGNLKTELARHQLSKHKEEIEDHSAFFKYLSKERKALGSELAIVAIADAAYSFTADDMGHVFPLGAAQNKLGQWYTNKIQRYNTELRHEDTAVKGAICKLLSHSTNVQLYNLLIKPTSTDHPLSQSNFPIIYIPYTGNTLSDIIDQVSDFKLPQLDAAVEVQHKYSTGRMNTIFDFPHKKSIEHRDITEKALGYLTKYLRYYIQTVMGLFEDTLWRYQLKFHRTGINTYDVQFSRVITGAAMPLTNFTWDEELDDLKITVENSPFTTTWKDPITTTRSVLAEGVQNESIALVVGLGVAAAAIPGIYYAAKAVWHGMGYSKLGRFRSWLCNTLLNFAQNTTSSWGYDFTTWYLDKIAAQDFQAIATYYLERAPKAKRTYIDYTGTDSGLTVAAPVERVLEFTFPFTSTPKAEDIPKLTHEGSVTLQVGWKLEILYFFIKKTGRAESATWILRRAATAAGLSARHATVTKTVLYYMVPNAGFLVALGIQEEDFADVLVRDHRSLFKTPDSVAELITMMKATNNDAAAKAVAGEHGIAPEEVDQLPKANESIMEQDGDTPPPSNAAGDDATPPTDYQTTPSEYGDSPKPGDYQTASGAIIPKVEVQQMVGDVLKKVGDQIQQGTTDTGEEEVPAEEPAEKSAVSTPPEQPEAPTEPEEPTEVPSEEEETEPEEPEGKVKTPKAGEEEGEEDEEEEGEEDEEEEDEEEEDEKKAKKKKQNEAVEINFRRLYGVRKSLAEFEVDARRSRWYPFRTLHPLTESILNNDTIMQLLALGIRGKRQAVRETCATFSSTHYSLRDLGFALGQANSLGSSGYLLLTEDDEEDMAVLRATLPEEDDLVLPSPEEEEVVLAMSDTEAEMADKKLDYVDTTIDPTADEVSATTAQIVKDEVAQEFIRNGDTEATLVRTQEINPDLSVDDTKEVVFNIQNTAPVDSFELPEPELPDVPIPDEDVIDTDPMDVLPPDAVESPPAVEINYGVDDENEMAYEGVLLKRDGMICEVATADGRIKISASRVRLLPTASDLSSCLQLMKKGASPKLLAERRLMSRVLGKPVDKLPRFRLDEDADYLVLYYKKEPTLCVESYGGYRDGNAAVIPLAKLSMTKRRQLVERLGRDSAYLVKSRTKILCDPYRSISEQLDVPEGDEGNTAAKSFEDAMALLQVARKALVDFEGLSGKIKSLVTLNDSGKRTAAALETLSKEVKDTVKELGEVMEQFSKTHDTFSKEFPDAKVEEEEEEAPEDVVPEDETIPDDAAADAAPEAPAAPEPAEEPVPEPAEDEKEAQAVAESLLTKYPFGSFADKLDFGRMGKWILQENRYLTPHQIARVVEIIKESVGI